MTKQTGRLAGWIGPAVMAFIVWAAPADAGAADRPTQETIGAWIIGCPLTDADPCWMRHRTWMVPPAGAMPGIALEVQRRGDALVPVVVVHGLPVAAALAGTFLIKPSVTFGFDGERRLALECGISGADYDCAPDAAAVPGLAAALPRAQTAWVRVALAIPGVTTLPPRDQSLELTDTDAALARLAALGPRGEALPSQPGLDLRGLLDQVTRDLGYPNGLADLAPRLVPWISWLWY